MLLAFAMHAKTDYAAEFTPKVAGEEDDMYKTHAKGKSLEILASWSLGATKGASGETVAQEGEYYTTMIDDYSTLLGQISAKLPSFVELDLEGEDVDWRKRRSYWFDIVRKVVAPSYYGPSIGYFGSREQGGRDGEIVFASIMGCLPTFVVDTRSLAHPTPLPHISYSVRAVVRLHPRTGCPFIFQAPFVLWLSECTKDDSLAIEVYGGNSARKAFDIVAKECEVLDQGAKQTLGAMIDPRICFAMCILRQGMLLVPNK